MRIYNLENKKNLKKNYFISKDKKLYKIKSDIFSNKLIISNKQIDKRKYNLIPPISPKKIICLAVNYRGISGYSSDMTEPLVFLKARNAITVKPKIRLPFLNHKVWGEPEIGVIIKRKLQNIKTLNKKTDILGYCIANDISSYNVLGRDHHLARSKSGNNYCPISEYIETEFDISNKEIFCFHNEILLRKGNTNEMIWSLDKIVTWLSSWITLDKGDLILTGSPPRVRDRIFFKKNDVFHIKIQGLGSIKSKIL